MTESDQKNSYLVDMDGVLVRGHAPIEGAVDFIDRLGVGDHQFMVLTNNPRYTPRDLSYRLRATGLESEPERI